MFWDGWQDDPIKETPRLRHRCCDGLRVLVRWSNLYDKTLRALINSGMSFFHLNGSLSTPNIRPLRFWLELKCLPIPVWFYSSTRYDTCAILDWECWQGVLIPIIRLYQLWTRIVRIPSTSIHHSPPLPDPSDFGLSWNAGQFLYGSTSAQVMSQVLWLTESVGRVFSYLQQASTSSGQQYSAFLPPKRITLHP